MKRLLYITDLFSGSSESAIDFIFKKHLLNYLSVDTLYLSKELKGIKRDNNLIIINYSKRGVIYKLLDLSEYDYIIVRNRFDVLNSLLKLKDFFNFKIGFQLTFPHTYRRLYQAKIEKRAIFRKSIEFLIKDYLQKRSIAKCDFFFPISKAMLDEFYLDIKTSSFIIPMGIECNYTPKPHKKKGNSLRLIYIGTVDKLRRLDVLFSGLLLLNSDSWHLDIYTKELEFTASLIPNEIKDKIKIYSYIPRDELLKRLPEYDLGLFLLPDTKLYKVASPTKVMDYYQANIPSLMSPIIELKELFRDRESGFFSEFEPEAIAKALKEILETTLDFRQLVAKRGREILEQKRAYCKIAKELFEYLEGCSEKD